MHVLVPDDPVFFAAYQSLEEPLLRRLFQLNSLHGTVPRPGDEQILSNAYDSWVRLLLKLPQWQRWDPARSPDEPVGYTLCRADGALLTSLYPVEVTMADLGHLTSCRDLLAADTAFADACRRVLEVLMLPPPWRLLAILREPAGVVTLPPEDEAAYRRYCEDVVSVLSAGDTFAYESHRALYP
ncbi:MULTISPECIES: hypothetical protein [unclassified Streptomyces]|uniref:hypothetical protein n=1 Tax=unclassified Streptomyces TaxID=2593676 RepID=UPI000DBAB099|nr:hypothetical protein [Streptomyces sp. PsTaAH-137]MYT69050.1 hypothetical protein [Streptomyces sp. SID8367]RAJ82558.1 hypothetical protein K377_04278 [Streptomyces sp. PsTaAH-137]